MPEKGDHTPGNGLVGRDHCMAALLASRPQVKSRGERDFVWRNSQSQTFSYTSAQRPASARVRCYAQKRLEFGDTLKHTTTAGTNNGENCGDPYFSSVTASPEFFGRYRPSERRRPRRRWGEGRGREGRRIPRITQRKQRRVCVRFPTKQFSLNLCPGFFYYGNNGGYSSGGGAGSGGPVDYSWLIAGCSVAGVILAAACCLICCHETR